MVEGNGGDGETDEGEGRESEKKSDVEHGDLTESVTDKSHALITAVTVSDYVK